MLQPRTSGATEEETMEQSPSGWFGTVPARGKSLIYRLLDKLVRSIPGAMQTMTPDERRSRIEERKREILREAGL